MIKLEPIYYQGYAYLQLSRLPFDHLLRFRNWISDTDVFAISNSFEIVENCVHYDRYDFWFEHIKDDTPHFEAMEF